MDGFATELPDHHRVLAAIVFSDAVSFSARMSADEERTLRLIERDLHLMSEICQRCEGRVLKSTGDGLLMYFTSAMQAVACAIEIQKKLAQNAKKLPENDILEHRIGIHLGDVFVRNNDVMGNGVNIAARLQSQAEPGGICLSKTVYDAVKKTLSIEATYLGPRELKNISDAFPVYQILLSGRSSKSRASKSLPSRQDYRNRQVLLDKVWNYWIKGVLETSLHGRVSLELGLESRDDMLDRPWSVVWQQEGTSHPLPSGTRAIDKFDELGAGRTLLILGEPGSGKTTTLLELARDLTERAKYDVALAIPVVFNLSSWSDKKQTLDRWLVAELNAKYQVGKDTARSWVENQKLLLLLDGLDEVSSDCREACVEAINQFCQQHGQTEIVACSRIRDYEALGRRLQLQGAICLQPLQLEQVRDYFNRAGQELAAVAKAIETDTTLQELARSPLMLSIITLAYRGISVEELADIITVEERRKHLFDTYIQRMFDRRFSDREYNDEQTKYWLSYLAKQLVREAQTVFFIERMQPSWLPNAWQVLDYNLRICSLLGAIFGAVILPIISLNSSLFDRDSSDVAILSFGALIGICFGIFSAFSWSGLARILGKYIRSSFGGLIFSLVGGFAYLPIGFVMIYCYKLLLLYNNFEFQLEVNLMIQFFLLFYSISALIELSFWGLIKSPIALSGKLQWSSASAKRKLWDGMLWGLGSGVVLGSIYWIANINTLTDFILPLPTEVNQNISTSLNIMTLVLGLINGLPLALVLEIIGGLIGFLIGGFTGTAIETTTVPNQGIWQTVRNAVILGTIATIAFGTISAFLGIAVSIAIGLGVLFGLIGGGITGLKHILLRLILRSLRLIPWNYARFLDYATSCIFLQKVGGGYIFIHRLLLEHFAAMEPKFHRLENVQNE